MEDLGSKYPEYDDMSLSELNEQEYLRNDRSLIINSEILNDKLYNHDELININKRKVYIDNLRLKIFNEYETIFTGSDDGKTGMITRKGSDVKTKVPAIEFVGEENFGDVRDNNFELVFQEQDEIENRLKYLSIFNKEIAENQTKRIKILNKKIKTLTQYRKTGADPGIFVR